MRRKRSFNVRKTPEEDILRGFMHTVMVYFTVMLSVRVVVFFATSVNGAFRT